MKPETHIFDDAILAAHAVATLIQELAIAKQQQNQTLNMAVSGGSTPKQLFTLLTGNKYRFAIPWEVIRFFWVDERCVEPAHPESNFGMTYDALLQYAFVPAQHIFRIKGEDIPANEAVRYANLLREELPARNGVPVFDIILLGIGDDGHTASIFPDNMALLNSEKLVDTATHPVSGQKRITLTGKTINNADQVVFLVTGKNKSGIIREITRETSDALKYPAFHVGNYVGEAALYLDAAAATEI
ncbi:MAG: 6-phosphogluconolactonase [Paludibacter sp.]|nr:6-phosphogluconolactonase [Paludibacter sp.]